MSTSISGASTSCAMTHNSTLRHQLRRRNRAWSCVSTLTSNLSPIQLGSCQQVAPGWQKPTDGKNRCRSCPMRGSWFVIRPSGGSRPGGLTLANRSAAIIQDPFLANTVWIQALLRALTLSSSSLGLLVHKDLSLLTNRSFSPTPSTFCPGFLSTLRKLFFF